MNALGFIGLLRSIYGRKLPDFEKIQKKGLLAVKIAQHYALRVDFLDEKVCRHLAQLYRKTLSVPAEDVDGLLRGYCDADWFESIRDFEKTPLASASVGQVHPARLRDGTSVIVKVIKQDFREAFLRDVRSLRRLIRVTLFFYPTLRKVFDPMGVLAYIEDYTLTELDLRNEIRGQETLKAIQEENGDRYDLSQLTFPTLYEDLSNANVLVAERLECPTFDELLERHELPYRTLLDLFNVHGFFLFGPGVFHGDIHPGNIFLKEDGTICFIDTGAVSRVGERIRRGLFRFFIALSSYDYPGCVRHLNEMAEHGLEGDAYRTFEERFLRLYEGFAGKTVSEASLTRQMMQTIKLAVRCGMEFEKGMFAIIKSMMYLDGMVLRCKPDAVLMEDMRPFIADFAKAIGS